MDETKADGLGEDFWAETEATLFLISHMPELYPVKHRNYHEALIDRFPFVIIYRVDEDKRCVIVLSIFHTSRSPKKKPN